MQTLQFNFHQGNLFKTIFERSQSFLVTTLYCSPEFPYLKMVHPISQFVMVFLVIQQPAGQGAWHNNTSETLESHIGKTLHPEKKRKNACFES